jgi:hypothetical protein
MSCTTKLSTQG